VYCESIPGNKVFPLPLQDIMKMQDYIAEIHTEAVAYLFKSCSAQFGVDVM
jgi:hypothetical protein